MSDKLSDIREQLEGALTNSEGRDFTIRAEFVREVLAALPAEPVATPIPLLKMFKDQRDRVADALRAINPNHPALEGIPTAVQQLEWWRNESHCKGEMRELGVPDDADAPLISMGDLRRLKAALQGDELIALLAKHKLCVRPNIRVSWKDSIDIDVPSYALTEFLKDYADALQGQRDGCPCLVVEPCSPHCSCANPIMSGGCQRCAKYGSDEQRKTHAQHIAKALQGHRPEGWVPMTQPPKVGGSYLVGGYRFDEPHCFDWLPGSCFLLETGVEWQTRGAPLFKPEYYFDLPPHPKFAAVE